MFILIGTFYLKLMCLAQAKQTPQSSHFKKPNVIKFKKIFNSKINI
jgi:hypothetical protein